MNHLVPPHGGTLVNLLADNGRQQELRAGSMDWPSLDLTPRQLCDLELLMTGGFSPLTGFLGQADYEAVCAQGRLTNGTLWPIPVVLDVPQAVADGLDTGKPIALRDAEGVMLAVLGVEECWQLDLEAEAEAVYGTSDPQHPGVAALLGAHSGTHNAGHDSVRVALSGRLEGVQLPVHYDYRELRLTPLELRRKFARLGWRKVMAYQTCTAMQRQHHEMTMRMAAEAGANLLIHPVVGMSAVGDVDHYTRVRCYQALLLHYPKYLARMSLLPLSVRRAQARGVLWHAIINKNHGCDHLLIEPEPEVRDAGPDAWQDAAVQVMRHREELGVTVVPAREMVYLAHRKTFVSVDEVPADARVLRISEQELHERLAHGREIPEWFTFSGVARELRRAYPPRSRQGFTVFFTGLSGSGKSTVANALRVKLLELGGRGVTLLDGDLVRRHLSAKLGFSKEDRDINIRRIGFVASEITRAGGIAICAPIAPYDAVRKEVRRMITPCGGFMLVHVATPLEVCEGRDRKGMYAKARKGVIKEFTGISDPYEAPLDAEVMIDTTDITPEEATREVLLHLESEGYISAQTEEE